MPAVERLAGALADRYRIERELGQGGMATVHLAEDLKHGRKVALKVMRPEVAAAIGPDRFLREIRTTATLRHPHIVPLFDSGEAEGQLWYAMPYVEGESLQGRLAREGQLGLDEALRLAREVAGALGYAHGRGVIHRDIKPGNILLESGHAVVADFGIASAVSVAGGAKLTQTGMIVGSPAYMSPEQASGDAGLDARSDLYSLGCVVYEMLTGQPPFTAPTAMVVLARHMLDPVPPIATARPGLPAHVSHAVERLLAKAPADRFGSAERWIAALEGDSADETLTSGARATRAEEGFWVAVLPFRHRGSGPGLEALAEGLTEDIVTGLSRFSYLRVISRSSAARFTGESVDVRGVGRELGARYVMEGSIRQAGPTLRISVQLVETGSGAHLWAEHYDRPFAPDEIFAVQDDVGSRIVSIVADMHGVLPHSMSESLRHRDPDDLTPYEMVLRGFGYVGLLTPDEHDVVRAGLQRAVERAPGNAECWAMLSMMYAEEHKHGFNQGPDPLARALEAARRAVEAAPASHLGYHMLAQALFFRREFQAFRNAADRAVALNPLDAGTTAFMGILLSYTGEWERGCALAERAMELNPHHPGWFRFAAFNNAYRRGDHRAALDVALRFNMPSYFYTHMALAAAYGKLGEQEAATRALRELLVVKPNIAEEARAELGKWMQDDLVDEWIDGLRLAGLKVPGEDDAGAPSKAPTRPAPSVVVVPFVNRSPDPDNDWFSDGLTEEIITDLSRISALRVISRNSSMALKGTTLGSPSLASELGVTHVVTGSVRRAGDALRITAELIDAPSDRSMWSEKYAGTLHDVFGIQEEIARKIVAGLEMTLTERESRQVAERPIEHPVGYDCYLRARQEMYSWLPDASRRALRLVDQALQIVGDTPLLLAMKGQLYWNEVNMSLVSADAGLSRAAAAAAAALALDPDHALAIFVRGLVAGSRGRPEEALPDLFRAHGLWPGDANVLAELCRYANTAGVPHGDLVDRLLMIDPLTPVTHLVASSYHWACGRFPEAVAPARRACEQAPPDSMVPFVASMELAAAGHGDEAAARLEGPAAAAKGTSLGDAASMLQCALRGDPDGALHFATSRLEQTLENEFAAIFIAEAFMLIGRPEDALRWVRRAIDRGFINYPFLSEHDPFLAGIRDDPGFRRLMSEVKPRWETVVAWEAGRGSGR